MKGFSENKNNFNEELFINDSNFTKTIVNILAIEPQFRDEQQLQNISDLLKKSIFNTYFSALNNDQLMIISKNIKLLQIRANKLLIPKGSHVDRFFIVIDGYLSLNYSGLLNNQIKYIFPGDSIGSQSLIHQQQQTNYNAYTGKEGCVIAFIEQEEFNENLRLSENIRIQKYIQVLNKVDILKGLSEDLILQMYYSSNTISLSKNKSIYSINNKTNGFYIIIQGQVQVYIKKIQKNDLSVNYDGSITQRKENIISYDSLIKIKELNQGDYFGHYEIIQQLDVRSQSICSSMDNTQILFLSNGIFQRFISIQEKSNLRLKNIVKHEELLMKQENGTFQLSKNNNSQSPKRVSNQFKSIERLRPIGMDILKITSPQKSISGDVTQSVSHNSTPRKSSRTVQQQMDKRFLDIIMKQGISSASTITIDTTNNNNNDKSSLSPLSILKKVTSGQETKLTKLSSQMLLSNKEKNPQLSINLGTLNIFKQQDQKIIDSKNKDVSTITPFSYDEDYFQKLESSERQSNNNENNGLNKQNNSEQINIQINNNSNRNINKFNIEENKRQYVNNKSDQQLTNSLSKSQLTQQISDESQFQSEHQLNYLKQSLEKFQNLNLERTVNNVNLVFNNDISSIKSSFIKDQLNQQNHRKSQSLTSLKSRILSDNLSPKQSISNNNNNKKLQLVSPKYKIINSSNTPLTNSQLMKAEDNNQSFINLSPSLRLKLNSPSPIIQIDQQNPQNQSNSMIQLISDCSHTGHRRALSQLLIQKKREASQNQQLNNNITKEEIKNIVKQPYCQNSFSQRYLAKPNQNAYQSGQQMSRKDNIFTQTNTYFSLQPKLENHSCLLKKTTTDSPKIKFNNNNNNNILKGQDQLSPTKNNSRISQNYKLRSTFSNNINNQSAIWGSKQQPSDQKIKVQSQQENTNKFSITKFISQNILQDSNNKTLYNTIYQQQSQSNTPLRKQLFKNGGRDLIRSNSKNINPQQIYSPNKNNSQKEINMNGGFSDFVSQYQSNEISSN